MNKEVIIFPAISEESEPGKVTRWLVKAGDPVMADQVIAELETDKAAFELTAATTGVIEALVQEGKSLQAGDQIAIIFTKGLSDAESKNASLEELNKKVHPLPGEIKLFAGEHIPAGWYRCQGQLLSVAEHRLLHAAIGYRFGGSGSNFNLPNLSGPQNLDYIIFADFE